MPRRGRLGVPVLLTIVVALGALVAIEGTADAATPTYLSTGTARNNNAATLPATMPPTWRAGNLLLLDVFHAGPEATTLTAPSGWTPVAGSPAKSSYGQEWRFVLPNAPAATSAPTLSFSSANVVIANVSSFQDAAGVGASASAVDGASNTTPIRQPTVTVNAGELLVVGDAERAATPPNPTVQPDPSYAEQAEASSTQANGSGGTLELAVKPIGTSGTDGGRRSPRACRPVMP